jgi:hypothetical protein
MNEATSWLRQCARASIVAPLAAVLVLCLASPLKRDQPAGVMAQIDYVAGSVATVIAMGGLAAGICAVIGGRRRGWRDTMMIAALGLFTGGALVLLWISAGVWWLWHR